MEVINLIKHMSATLNYRKYVTPSLSTYPWFSHYSRAHIIKGIWVPSSSMFSIYTLLLAPSSCHHAHGVRAANVDEGVPDLALARDQIWLVVIGAELGRGFRSGLYRH